MFKWFKSLKLSLKIITCIILAVSIGVLSVGIVHIVENSTKTHQESFDNESDLGESGFIPEDDGSGNSGVVPDDDENLDSDDNDNFNDNEGGDSSGEGNNEISIPGEGNNENPTPGESEVIIPPSGGDDNGLSNPDGGVVTPPNEDSDDSPVEDGNIKIICLRIVNSGFVVGDIDFSLLILSDGSINSLVNLEQCESELDELCSELILYIDAKFGDVDYFTDEMERDDDIINNLIEIKELLMHNVII